MHHEKLHGALTVHRKKTAAPCEPEWCPEGVPRVTGTPPLHLHGTQRVHRRWLGAWQMLTSAPAPIAFPSKRHTRNGYNRECLAFDPHSPSVSAHAERLWPGRASLRPPPPPLSPPTTNHNGVPSPPHNTHTDYTTTKAHE